MKSKFPHEAKVSLVGNEITLIKTTFIRKLNRPILIVLLSLFMPTLSAQQLSSSITGKIDSLFSEFNVPNTPGCAIGVIRNDSLIYAKGYGLANLNKEDLISPQTMFYLPSVSKQFTAYSIVLLAKAGKLKLEDDIRSHLPWFPDLKRKITIRYLLNHTSGLRDNLEMAEFGGLGNDKGVSQELALRYIKNSRDLNFEPGHKYLYSNSNYVLLAEIVKERSGQSFKAFTGATLFKPLQMNNTLFIDRSSELPKERAISYIKEGNQYKKASRSVFTMGDGGMFSNIEDLSKWVMDFYKTEVGDANDIAQLTQNGIRYNGNKIDYALGVVVNEHNGFRQFTHSGGLGGYRTNIAVFPDLKMGFIILSNNGAINAGSKTNQLADIFLKHYPSPGVTNKLVTIQVKDTTALDLTRAKAMAGSYISEEGLPFKFSFNGQNLYWETRTVGAKRLIQTAKGTFEEPSIQTKFVFASNGKDTSIQQYLPGNDRLMTKYIPDSSFIIHEAKAYTGTYFSTELGTKVEIIFKDDRLLLKTPKIGIVKMNILNKENMIIEERGNRFHIKFLTDADVISFEFTSQRMMHVRFDKVK